MVTVPHPIWQHPVTRGRGALKHVVSVLRYCDKLNFFGQHQQTMLGFAREVVVTFYGTFVLAKRFVELYSNPGFVSFMVKTYKPNRSLTLVPVNSNFRTDIFGRQFLLWWPCICAC